MEERVEEGVEGLRGEGRKGCTWPRGITLTGRFLWVAYAAEALRDRLIASQAARDRGPPDGSPPGLLHLLSAVDQVGG